MQTKLFQLVVTLSRLVIPISFKYWTLLHKQLISTSHTAQQFLPPLKCRPVSPTTTLLEGKASFLRGPTGNPAISKSQRSWFWAHAHGKHHPVLLRHISTRAATPSLLEGRRALHRTVRNLGATTDSTMSIDAHTECVNVQRIPIMIRHFLDRSTCIKAVWSLVMSTFHYRNALLVGKTAAAALHHLQVTLIYASCQGHHWTGHVQQHTSLAQTPLVACRGAEHLAHDHQQHGCASASLRLGGYACDGEKPADKCRSAAVCFFVAVQATGTTCQTIFHLLLLRGDSKLISSVKILRLASNL